MGLIGNKPNQVPTNGDLGTMAFQDASLYQTRSELQGFRNRIINGDMRIDQRNNGASVTPAEGAYLLDRWQAKLSQNSKFSVQQSSVAPAGFSNSLLVTSLSAYTVGAAEYFTVRQFVEGFNFADMAFGTASASPITLSFWVRSSLTGTFGAVLRNSAADRSYPFTYTISAANTWEQKTVTFAGDTTGTWVGATNGVGICVDFALGAGASVSGTAGSWQSATYRSATGAVSVVGTNGATWQITGVQLEAGSVATPFERRPYGTELALCQRYYQRVLFIASGYVSAVQDIYSAVNFPVPMRVSPSITKTAGVFANATDPGSPVATEYSFSAYVRGSAAGQAYGSWIGLLSSEL